MATINLDGFALNTKTISLAGRGAPYNDVETINAGYLRIENSNAAFDISISGFANPFPGRIILVKNVADAGGDLVVFLGDDPNSLPENRFEPGDYNLSPGHVVFIVYDGEIKRWRAVAG